MEGEEAEKSKRRRGDETADLWGIDRIEIELLDFGPYERAFAQCLVEALFDKAGVDAGEVDKVEIETGLGSCGDDEEWNESQRDGAIPEKATNHQHEKEVEAVEEFLVVGVLHLAHSLELFGP